MSISIDEAIKEIKAWQVGKGNPSYDKLNKALDLSIEALKFFKEFQRVTGGHQDARLPGETEE